MGWSFLAENPVIQGRPSLARGFAECVAGLAELDPQVGAMTQGRGI